MLIDAISNWNSLKLIAVSYCHIISEPNCPAIEKLGFYLTIFFILRFFYKLLKGDRKALRDFLS
jgi:hypothetical protein